MKLFKALSFITLVFSFFASFSVSATEYSITASLDAGAAMTRFYRVKETNIGYQAQSDSTYLVVRTEGDCQWELSPQCKNVYAPDGSWMYRDCWNDVDKICKEETGLYVLNKDQIIFDGNKRLKYIGNGKYETIARKNRIWFAPWQREWQLDHDTCSVSVSEDMTEATLKINIKE